MTDYLAINVDTDATVSGMNHATRSLEHAITVVQLDTGDLDANLVSKIIYT